MKFFKAIYTFLGQDNYFRFLSDFYRKIVKILGGDRMELKSYPNWALSLKFNIFSFNSQDIGWSKFWLNNKSQDFTSGLCGEDEEWNSSHDQNT